MYKTNLKVFYAFLLHIRKFYWPVLINKIEHCDYTLQVAKVKAGCPVTATGIVLRLCEQLV